MRKKSLPKKPRRTQCRYSCEQCQFYTEDYYQYQEHKCQEESDAK